MSLIVKVGKAGKRVVKKFLPEENHHVSYTRRIERVKTRERVVAMTFDDGPMDLPSSPDKFDGKALTDILLDTLGEYGAQGTFDVVGDTSENYPDTAGKSGQADWGGVRYDHYPDINQDERGGAVHNQRLLRRMLDEGHQVTNHGYRHVLFGKKPFVYGKRDHFHGLDQVVSDLTRLHTLLKETYGYEMTMARPPHYVDKIEGGFTSYDAYDQMGYLYLAAAFDGAGWLPLHHGSAQESLRAEVEAMVDPMRKVLEADPDGLAGQIIFQKDGYNMCRRTPVAFGLKKQLELLKKYGYQVVTVQRLMEYSPFADVGREDPGFEKLVRLQKTRGIVYSDNRLRLDTPMTWGELAMLLAPRGEAIGRRIQKIRETGTAQHANWGAMDWCAEQGILKYAMDPDGAVSSLPSAYFAPAKGFTRRQVYEAFRE